MTVKNNGETKLPTKSRRLLHSFSNFCINAFTRIKLFFSRPKGTLSEANTGNAVNIKFPDKDEQKNVAYNSPYFLILPPGIRNKFFGLASSRREVNLPLMNHAGNHSTLALLTINNMYFWGFNNVIPALTPGNLNDLRAIFRYEKNISAYSAILTQAEADAIVKAFKQQINADRATMFIDRNSCNICGRREYNETYLRRLLPLLSLKELTVYTTNARGKITKLVLSPLLTSRG